VRLFRAGLGDQTAAHEAEIESILRDHGLSIDPLETPQDLLAPLPEG
jgi:hypothetical protein